MPEATVQASQRELAVGVLLSIAQDEKVDVDDRMSAACAVVDATAPYTAPAQDQDAALRVLADQVADRILERIELAAEPAHA